MTDSPPDASGKFVPAAFTEWKQALVRSALLIAIMGVAAALSRGSITGFFFVHQDIPVGLLAIALFVFISISRPPGAKVQFKFPTPDRLVWPAALLLIFGGWFGHHVVTHGYALSRDEQMALHDAEIFARGQFAAPLPTEWREMAAALNRNFMSSAYGPDWTISGYRPVNALFHMAMSKVGLVNFTAPVMASIGLIATWRVTKRMWPADRQLQSFAILFYLCSAQIWTASMTSYAMNTLLAINMVWLAFFLRRDATGYGVAILIGFLGVGVHQVPYHPMFVAPFIALLLIERRWALALVFAGSYLASILFWTRYEDIAAILMGIGPLDRGNDSITSTMLSNNTIIEMVQSLGFTAANLFRYFAWQHLLLLPLLLVAGKAAFRERNWLLIAMFVAFLLPPMMKLFQIPYQGHGWGYRYVHGAIGLTCILAAVGWRELTHQGLQKPPGLILASALTLFVALPWQLSNAWRFSAGYAQVDKQMTSLKTDFVVVDTLATPFGSDLINNKGDLSNRPLRLVAANIKPGDISTLCRRGSVTLLPTKSLAVINNHWGMKTETTPEYQALIDGFRKQCPGNLN